MTAQKQVEASKGEAMTFDLDDFGCIGILRVLKTVTKFGPLNITLLGRKTNLSHTSCDNHVKKLIARANYPLIKGSRGET